MDDLPPLVLVEWEDSARPAPEWCFVADLGKISAVRCSSVGWLIHDGKDVKALAPNMGSGDHSAQACGIIKIPARSVVSVTLLKKAGQR